MKCMYRLAPVLALNVAFAASAADAPAPEANRIEVQAHTIVGTCTQPERGGSESNPQCQFDEPPANITRSIQLQQQSSEAGAAPVWQGQWDQDQGNFHSGLTIVREGQGNDTAYTVVAYTSLKGQEGQGSTVTVTVKRLEDLNEIFLPGAIEKVNDKTTRVSGFIFGHQVAMRAVSSRSNPGTSAPQPLQPY